MANARLLSLKLERFKSYEKPTLVEFRPLTVILGRNNSGKSTIIQALLLLKQTLGLPRLDVPLHLEGLIDALSLRDLTFGWPPSGQDIDGPRFTLRWASTVNTKVALELARSPDLFTVANTSGVKWLFPSPPVTQDLITELDLNFAELDGRTVLREVKVSSFLGQNDRRAICNFTVKRTDRGSFSCQWSGETASQLQVEMDHFLPYLVINRRNIGPRDKQRSWHNAFLVVFAQPLDDLKELLLAFSYLGPMRTVPVTLYRPATVPPDDLGVSGEYAAQMLHARRGDLVHYLPPLVVVKDKIEMPDRVMAFPLVDAMNHILAELGVDTKLGIEDVKDVGFRLLFGHANLQHVGRGLSYLLPVIELGLISDPLRFQAMVGEMDLSEYISRCDRFAHAAFEEPEAHLHPKIQTRLAHWLVALARARRQLFVETHSDHLIRRLRGLAARARPGSELERWLTENVSILQVEQLDGRTTVTKTELTPAGGLEKWPSDFMDEATDEERSIYEASLEKEEIEGESPAVQVEHDVGSEPEVD